MNEFLVFYLFSNFSDQNYKKKIIQDFNSKIEIFVSSLKKFVFNLLTKTFNLLVSSLAKFRFGLMILSI